MAPPRKYSYDDRALLEDAPRCSTMRELAEAHGIPPTSLAHYIRNRPRLRDKILERLGTGDQGSGASLTVDDSHRCEEFADLDLGDIRRLLASRGLDADDWLIGRARVNEWGAARCPGCDAEVKPLTQLRVDLEPARNVLAPARADGWVAPPRAEINRDEPYMVMVSGDRHCPLHDEGLHAASLEWLREFRPAMHVDVGDLLDFAELSRHRKNPARPQAAQACIDTGYGVKRAEIEASPDTHHVFVPGNHDYRLRNDRIDKQPAGYGLRRADNPDLEPERWGVESLPHLLRFDELGIRFIGGDDEYDQYEFEIAPGLYALHGFKSRPNAGQSVHAMIDAYAASVIVGHVHRQGITTLTKRDDQHGNPREYHGMEVGTMARRGDSLGYDHHGNHQHGFGTVIVWPDGVHLFELARWDGRSLVWRNWRCTP